MQVIPPTMQNLIAMVTNLIVETWHQLNCLLICNVPCRYPPREDVMLLVHHSKLPISQHRPNYSNCPFWPQYDPCYTMWISSKWSMWRYVTANFLSHLVGHYMEVCMCSMLILSTCKFHLLHVALIKIIWRLRQGKVIKGPVLAGLGGKGLILLSRWNYHDHVQENYIIYNIYYSKCDRDNYLIVYSIHFTGIYNHHCILIIMQNL